MKKNQNIQTLRGVAILSVLAYHSKSGLFPNGYLGVDIFFFISGFLIIPKIQDAIKSNSLKQFYIRRFFRLAPALLFTIAVTFPLVLVLGGWKSHQDFVYQSLWTLLLLGNVGAIVITGNYFSPNSFHPMVHTWSLSVEEQVYIILPLLMRFNKTVLPIFSAFSFFIYIFQDWFPESVSSALFYLFISRVWEFHIGYLATKLRLSTKTTNSQFRHSTLGILLLILLFPSTHSRNIETITSLALATCLVLFKPLSGRHINLFVFLGDRAYSLYLFHMPLLYLAKFTPIIYGDNRSIYSLLAIVATFLFAEISFKKIEFIMKQK